MNRKKIVVAPESEFRALRRLFGLLGELYPVDFEVWRPGGSPSFDGAILWEGCAEEKAVTSARSCDRMVVARPGERKIPVQKHTVKFGQTASLDECFRGQTMFEESVEEFPALRPRDSDEIVCGMDSLPYWLVRHNDGATTSIVALGPEEMSERQTVYDHFNRRRWLRLLPFFHFLKRLTSSDAWQPPPLRACFMFDDPNLHWPTYGFLDLRKLALHARDFNYHVSFAMVPLDAWFVNPRVGPLFRENRANLSLCMHGNDHARAELGAPLGADDFTRLLAQGLKRIDRFEKRSGVSVSRVMVPPYGAFREEVADPMLKLGYEAACVSRASLTSWNKEKAWLASFGHPVAEFIGQGLPVIPRQVMAPGHEGSYRLAAFLNQPIIPHGHHQDCENGFDLLSNAANSINSLGKVIWSDMASLSRSNYLTKRENGTLTVKMLSRRIALPVDKDVREVVVERPWISADGKRESLVCREGDRAHTSGAFGRYNAAIPVSGQGRVELISQSADAVDYREVESPRFQVWSRARRFLSETRDRLAPLGFGRHTKLVVAGNGQ
jgi:hypothetical protein